MMWRSPKITVGPGERKAGPRSGSMAHRKGLVTARVGGGILVVLLFAVLMAGRVVLLNQMTTMRTNIAVLADEKGFLETQSAALLSRWNNQTSVRVISARAEKELGLTMPEQPGLVLVRLPADPEKSRWGWPRWLEGLGGGDVAQAGEFALVQTEGRMVHLNPAVRKMASAQEINR